MPNPNPKKSKNPKKRSSPKKPRPLRAKARGEARNPGRSGLKGAAVPEDTICGIASPPGEGGIGIIRISGEGALMAADRCFLPSNGKPLARRPSHTLQHGTVVSPEDKEPLDEVMAAVFRAPKSYTREDTVELYCHGAPFLLRRILDLLVSAGARLAEPGEFTRRAFLNGRIDLTRAEAVMDLIHSRTEAARRAAFAQLDGGLHRPIVHLREKLIGLLAEVEAGLDFIEEDIAFISQKEILSGLNRVRDEIVHLLQSARRGKLVREGIRAAIFGNPNVGKSSLLNALLDQNRAIVSSSPGTTRDLVEGQFSLEGTLLSLTDTAGLRQAQSPIEKEGIARARKAVDESDLALWVVDASGLHGSRMPDAGGLDSKKEPIMVLNKIDRVDESAREALKIRFKKAVLVSAHTGEGLNELKRKILDAVQGGKVQWGEREALINERHQEALVRAEEAISQSIQIVNGDSPVELLAFELRKGIDCLGEITGETTTESLLDQIFKRFCIGK